MPPDVDKSLCPVCKKKDPDVQCFVCEVWYHQKCVLPGLKLQQIKTLNWFCDDCKKAGLARLKEYNSDMNKLKEKNAIIEREREKLIADLEVTSQLKAELEGKLCALSADLSSLALIEAKIQELFSSLRRIENVIDKSSEKNENSYAAAVKQKNLLAIKSNQENMKAVEKKKEVAEILADFTIVDTKFPPNGNIVMNFQDKTSRDRAAEEIEGKIPGTQVKKIGYLNPKIMICNVHIDEEDIDAEDKQGIIEKMLAKNEFLKNITNVESKIEFLFMRPSAAKTFHLILKCDPEVRKAIHDQGDKIKLAFAVYHIRDRYHVRICSYCQRFGHLEKDCQHKSEDPYCGKCAERHDTRSCQSSSLKCINCVRKKKCHTNHKVGDKHCEALHDEHTEIAAKTNHGF